MEKPYDLKDLESRLISAGLQPAKDGVRAVITTLFAWARESAHESTNKYDDLAVGVLDSAEKFLLKQVDQFGGAAPASLEQPEEKDVP